VRGQLCPLQRKEGCCCCCCYCWRIVGEKRREKRHENEDSEGEVAKKDARENATRVAGPPPRRKWRNFPAAAVCYSFLSLLRREIRCIIHDFVNVACRCIFTALYLEKFRAVETRYRAASACGILENRGSRRVQHEHCSPDDATCEHRVRYGANRGIEKQTITRSREING